MCWTPTRWPREHLHCNNPPPIGALPSNQDQTTHIHAAGTSVTDRRGSEQRLTPALLVGFASSLMTAG